MNLIDALLAQSDGKSAGGYRRGDAASIDLTRAGQEMYALIEDLYPICRSITGEGLRQTLDRIQERIPLDVYEVPSGTKVFDWEVPREWNIRDAYILDSSGARVIDFKESNLHVVNYSVPVHATLKLSELKKHMHTLPDQPDWIPYRTTYYDEEWGFCLSHRQFESLSEGTYTAVIDSELTDGSMSYGESRLPGRTNEEILLFAHCCHPSLCNDNLTGIVLLTALVQILTQLELRHTVTIVFAPATIGSIAWLARNEARLKNIRAGLVASVLGDPGIFRYKRSRRGNTLTDRACEQILKHSGAEFTILDFSPWGYDERQFCSPGIDLPMGRLTRSPNGEYPEYHTSADNLDLVRRECLSESLRLYLEFVASIELNRTYINTNPQCEPQLGRRGLYRKLGGFQHIEDAKLAMLWMLNQSDGNSSLLDIAATSDMPLGYLHEAAEILCQKGLLEIAAENEEETLKKEQ